MWFRTARKAARSLVRPPLGNEKARFRSFSGVERAGIATGRWFQPSAHAFARRSPGLRSTSVPSQVTVHRRIASLRTRASGRGVRRLRRCAGDRRFQGRARRCQAEATGDGRRRRRNRSRRFLSAGVCECGVLLRSDRRTRLAGDACGLSATKSVLATMDSGKRPPILEP